MSSAPFREALGALAPGFQIDLEPRLVDRFARHYDLLLTWNRKINLTRIVDPEEAARHHFLESAFLATIAARPERVVDVGSGAGFPGVPLACMWPEVETVLVEPSPKRAIFLKEVVRALDLEHVSVCAEPFTASVVDERTLLTARALDGFRELLPALMGAGVPRIALFSEPDLLAAAGALAPDRSVQTIALPGAERRFIGLFDR